MNPPWPPPSDLAAGVEPPLMVNRDDFVRDAVRRFGDEEYFAAERWNAARRLLSDGDLDGLAGAEDTRAADMGGAVPRVLTAWLLTPREAFIPEENRLAAYLPQALPVGHNQTISAPYMVSRMTAALNPGPEDKVLEIGTGSGYQAAMLAPLSAHVRTVEYVGPLAASAGQILEALAERRPWLEQIRRRTGNGYMGWEEGAPYDRIIVTCAIDHIPPALTDQLAPGGILILPLGERRVQRLTALRRRRPGEETPPDSSWSPLNEDKNIDFTDVYRNGTRVVFVPFIH